MTVEGKLKQDIPEFIIEVARFLAKISNYQLYAYAVAGLALLSLFLGMLAAGSRDWIILVVPALAAALIGACFAGRWWQNKRTFEQLLQYDYFDLCGQEAGWYDSGKCWLKNSPSEGREK